MVIQRMNSHVSGGGHQSQLQPPTSRHNSWLSLTFGQVETHLGDLGKPLGSMNVDELLMNVLTTEARHLSRLGSLNTSPSASLQHQVSWSLARAFSGRTVDEVWSDIRRGYRRRSSEVTRSQDREATLGETTLEDFLVKAGMHLTNASIEPVMSLDSTLKSHNFSTQMGLSLSPSIDEFSDSPVPGWKRSPWGFEKTLDRRLRRKINNRESAARSRARKQAYHNELMIKVSHLEEENVKLKKEKQEFDQMVSYFPEPRSQLRRTTSF